MTCAAPNSGGTEPISDEPETLLCRDRPLVPRRLWTVGPPTSPSPHEKIDKDRSFHIL